MDAATKAYLLVRGGSCTGGLSPGLTGRLADLVRRMPGEADEVLGIVSAAWGEGSADGYEEGKEDGYQDGCVEGEIEGRREAEAEDDRLTSTAPA